jgi:co-chaperonin GroES (HSP10)
MLKANRFQPSPGRVLVKIDEAIMASKSAIILPESVKDNECSRFAIVMAIGPQFDGEDLRGMVSRSLATATKWKLEVGDSVLFHVHEALALKLDGEDYYLVDEEDILGKINLE